MGKSIFQHAGVGIEPAPAPSQAAPEQSLTGAKVMAGGVPFMNPAQKAALIYQAMTNPAAFVKQQFPDIPDAIANNPQEILGYLQRTRGISQDDIMKAQAQNPFGGGR